MAFIATDLSVLAYANNFTLWHFATTDSDIETDGYFNSAADMLHENDLIISNTDTEGTPETTFYVVSANDGSSVSIAAYA